MRYDIADHINEDARRKAAALAYTLMMGLRSPMPRDKRGYCPIGAALGYALLSNTKAPLPSQVADALLLLSDENSTRDQLIEMAAAFLGDWDAGRIDNLAEALGVEVPS